MNDKQNPGPVKDDSTPVDDGVGRDQNEPAPKDYYYDDATGYEIYQDDDEDEEEGS
jgi:hypothetical protein